MSSPPNVFDPIARESRRRCLAWLATLLCGLPAAVRAHGRIGPVVPPQPAPDVGLWLDDGRPVGLRTLLQGRATAVQFMFTGCSAICPVQGALFAQAQARLQARPAAREARLLSLSLDPLGDTPAALAAWRQRHGADDVLWRAAVPRQLDASQLMAAFNPGEPERDAHMTQVYLFDRQARLVWRTAELPDPAEIADRLAP
ncbi:SCO family protein [Caldimonas brevitalea]|uniref:Thioredoxin domain-containing protein n=1 Tax=Caldimonas brevitalea TaxID=413882 RepID=A0A0G3BHY1_9BURK|nr:SCO family protein [Caldimonas brevitalea]AKJ27593.1 hypothetical protein AAW51_0902 [Caldimonas brevitalea]